MRFVVIIIFIVFHLSLKAQINPSIDFSIGAGIVDVESAGVVVQAKEVPALSTSVAFIGTYSSRKFVGVYVSSGTRLSYIGGSFKFNDEYLENLNRYRTEDEILLLKNTSNCLLVGIPLLVGYKAKKISLETGVEVSYNVYQQVKSEWIQSSRNSNVYSKQKSKVQLKKDLLFGTTTSVGYRVSDKFSFRLNVSVGLTEYLMQESPSLNPDFKSRIHSALLGVRYHL